MSTRRIMVATDGSAGANRAVEAAAGLAKDLNADLTIATFGGSFSSEQIEQLRRTEGQVGEAVELLLNSILRDAKERAERIGAPKIRIHSEWGDGRGRDGHCWPPPAQIPACGATAPGSYLG